MTATITADEMFESLNRFDEIAITEAFETSAAKLAAHDEFGFIRAMVFAHLRREGQVHRQAREQAFTMPLGEVMAYFPDDDAPEDEDPEAPVSAAGKGDSQPE